MRKDGERGKLTRGREEFERAVLPCLRVVPRAIFFGVNFEIVEVEAKEEKEEEEERRGGKIAFPVRGSSSGVRACSFLFFRFCQSVESRWCRYRRTFVQSKYGECTRRNRGQTEESGTLI